MDQELRELNSALLRSYDESYEFISGEISPSSYDEYSQGIPTPEVEPLVAASISD